MQTAIVKAVTGMFGDSRRESLALIGKRVEDPESSTLAALAVMASTPAEDDSFNRGLADQAGLAGAEIDTVLKLKEAFATFGVDIVGNGGSAQPDRLLQHLLDRNVQAIELSSSEPSCLPAWTDTRAKQRLISVDVPHPMQQLLIEQSSFDRSLASAKELGKIVGADGERLSARPGKALVDGYAQPAKAPRIHESQLAS